MARFVRRNPRRTAFLALVVLVAAGAATGARASQPSASFTDAAGLHVVASSQLDQRDYNVEVLSPDLGRPVNVRILLPADYFLHPATRYPVLYLFHGTSGRASDWIDQGSAEQTTAPYELITVMPDVGFNGDGGFWFTNWVDRTTSHGPSQFEDYLVGSLIPWVDFNLRTRASRDGRAVAGLSQGGYGAAEIAARHPDMFVSMASFSGAPEIARDPEVFAGAVAVIEAIEVGDDQVPPFSELGDPLTDLVNWQGHDPATLVTNLRGMSLNLWTGTGLDGPYDPTPNPPASLIEGAAYQSTQHFYDHLAAEGIPAYYDNYVYGTHTFAYWARDLREYVPMMMADFAHPRRPSSVSYTSIDKNWEQWGYSVSFERTATQEFGSVIDADPNGFIISGSGVAAVTTPPDYQPHSTVVMTIQGPEGTTSQSIPIGPTGRATGLINLGSSTHQAQVTIRPLN
ncbi:MAG TPA: alpha/beta hydrolase family protein [Acidimicrobiales bacterium]|nr:alpha/beta hydrolase family protein [Acidimicrobiales bacterium]